MSSKGGPIFTFSLPGRAARPFAPVSYATGCSAVGTCGNGVPATLFLALHPCL